MTTFRHDTKRLCTLLLAALLPLAMTAQEQHVGETGALSADTLNTDSLPPLTWEQRVQQQLDSLVANSELLQTTQLGLMVWDLTADSAFYTCNHRQRMRPASTMKLLTAITAIDRLGGDHQFRTTVKMRGTLTQRTDSTGGTLTGDLVCIGGMDPAFDNGDMKVLVDRIRQAGIDTICGRIVADKSFKDTLQLGQGWCWDDDNPCLSALLVNRKDNFADRLRRELETVGVVIKPTPSPSSREGSVASPERQVKADQSPVSSGGGGGGFSVSHSLSHILTRMMKQSDNLYAECVFYHAALSEPGSDSRTATAKNARSAVKREIQSIGLDPSHYSVADGSGLSLYNYVSAELLTMMLRHAWRSDRISQHLLPTLPVAGVDGTLKDRMTKSAAYRNVRAKTGTLTGISSLAGYCTAGNGHQLCFAIINQGVEKAKSGKAFQDKVCALLCTVQ